jgi:hypothetical protein
MADGDEEGIPYDDIAHFIVQVRKLVCRDHQTLRQYERTMQRIKNLSTRLFREHIGYSPDGGYRLKKKGERMFRNGVQDVGGREKALTAYAGKNPYLSKILRGDEGEACSEGAQDPPVRPSPLIHKEPPIPEWAEEFDPESKDSASNRYEAPAALVDMEDLAREAREEGAVLEFEPLEKDVSES